MAPVAWADFDQNYQPINSGYPAAAPSSYVVTKGQSLRDIAQAVWGDASLWYLIAEANGLVGTEVPTAGMTLWIPNKVTNIRNNSGTFRVYNAGEAIGNTSPTISDIPPPAKKCGGLGIIIAIIVAAVATVLTAGALAGASGGLAGLFSGGISALGAGVTGLGLGAAGSLGVAGFAVAGAVGSIASQAILLATGDQQSFSWKAVGLAAIGSVVGGSLPGFSNVPGGALGQAAFRAGVGNVITQGVGVATGLQKSFSWRSVAASAVSGGVSYAVGNAIGEYQYGQSGWKDITTTAGSLAELAVTDPWMTAARNLASGISAGAASSLVRGGRVNWGAVVQDAVGATIGESVQATARLDSSRNQIFREQVVATLASVTLPVDSSATATDAPSVLVDTVLVTAPRPKKPVNEFAAESARIQRYVDIGQRARGLVDAKKLIAESAYYKSPIDSLARQLADRPSWDVYVTRKYGPSTYGPETRWDSKYGSISAKPGLFDSLSEIANGTSSFVDKSKYAADEIKYDRRTKGTLQIVSGAAQVSAGIALSGTGIGNGIAPIAYLSGGDDIYTGFQQVFFDGDGKTGRFNATKWLTGSTFAAEIVEDFTPFVSAVGSLAGAAGKLAPTGRKFLTSDDFRKLPEAGRIDPDMVRFSQNDIGLNFRPPFGSVKNFTTGLFDGSVDPALVKPIRLVEREGLIFTLDNRRLYSYQQVGIPIPYEKLNAIPPREMFKFSTVNDGTSVVFRKGN